MWSLHALIQKTRRKNAAANKKLKKMQTHNQKNPPKTPKKQQD